jgi:Ala-tRNA(Pro) deacylase
MVVATKLRKCLDEHKVPYQVLKHHKRFTSSEIAQVLHVPGQELAKVVIVKADGRLHMAVLPANFKIDLPAFARAAGAGRAELATEAEFQGAFPDCDVGAMPPFGNLYGLATWVDKTLTRDDQIVFEAGSHEEAVKLGFTDFVRIVKPQIADFSLR